MPNYFDDLRERLAMTSSELGRGEDFPAVQPVVTGASSYSGSFKPPEDAIPMSPEILDYLQGKMPEQFSPEARATIAQGAKSREGALILPELIANLGGGIAGQGGLSASPVFDKMRQRIAAETTGRFDTEKKEEENRLMEIANYLRLANRPQWEAESQRAKIDLQQQQLEELKRWRDFQMKQTPFEQEMKKRNVAAREADVAGKAKRAEQNLVAAYQDDLTRAGVPEATSIINTINERVPETGEIPGWKQGQFLPDAALPAEVVPTVAAIRSLFNITLKNRSGAAVTDQELERLKGEFFAGKWASSDQLRMGILNYTTRLRDVAKGIAGGYSPEIQKQYLQNIEQGMPVAPKSGKPSLPVSSEEKLLLLKQLLEKQGK